jgi:hypothetical protein
MKWPQISVEKNLSESEANIFPFVAMPAMASDSFEP